MTITISRGKAALGGALVGLAMLALTAGPLVAQTDTPLPGGTPMAGDMGMMGAATPEAGGPKAESMEDMMEQCMAMMEMMMGMMGGDMSGMMGGQGLQSATPGPGQ